MPPPYPPPRYAPPPANPPPRTPPPPPRPPRRASATVDQTTPATARTTITHFPARIAGPPLCKFALLCGLRCPLGTVPSLRRLDACHLHRRRVGKIRIIELPPGGLPGE